MLNSFLTSSLFWGIILILCGVLIVVDIMAGKEMPIVRALIAAIFFVAGLTLIVAPELIYHQIAKVVGSTIWSSITGK